MARYQIHMSVSWSRQSITFEVEADNEEEAEMKGWDALTDHASVFAEEIEENGDVEDV